MKILFLAFIFTLSSFASEVHYQTVELNNRNITLDFQPLSGELVEYNLKLLITPNTPNTVKLTFWKNRYHSKECIDRTFIHDVYYPGSVCNEYRVFTLKDAVTLKLKLAQLNSENGVVNFKIKQTDLGSNAFNGDYTQYSVEDHDYSSEIFLGFGRFSNKRVIYFNQRRN